MDDLIERHIRHSPRDGSMSDYRDEFVASYLKKSEQKHLSSPVTSKNDLMDFKDATLEQAFSRIDRPAPNNADYGIIVELAETKRILLQLERQKDEYFARMNDEISKNAQLLKQNQILQTQLEEARRIAEEPKYDLQREMSHINLLDEYRKNLERSQEKASSLELDKLRLSEEISRLNREREERAHISEKELSERNQRETEFTELARRLREKLAKYKGLYDEKVKLCSCGVVRDYQTRPESRHSSTTLPEKPESEKVLSEEPGSVKEEPVSLSPLTCDTSSRHPLRPVNTTLRAEEPSKLAVCGSCSRALAKATEKPVSLFRWPTSTAHPIPEELALLGNTSGQ